jgi:hypothetical protein
MRLFAFVLLALGALGLSAAWGAERPIVAKLTSGKCGESERWISSATLYVRGGTRVYLVASSERVFDSNQYCHEYELPDGTRGEARLKRHDWGMNLAYFDTDLSAAQVRPPSEGSPHRQSAVVHYYDSARGTFTSQKTRLVSNGSTRHLFASLDSVYEVVGTPFPNSVVGAPIMTEEGDQLLGIITSQHIMEVPGSSARIEEWGYDPAQSHSHLTALKRYQLDDWIYRSLPWLKEPFYVDPEDQLRGLRRVTTGNLTFTADCPKPGAPTGTGGYPIGGVDAAGIGGSSVSNPPCKIRVEEALFPAEFAYPERKEFHDQLLNRIRKGSTVEILLGYDREDGYLLGRALVGLGSFFSGLKNKSLRHLIEWGKPETDPALDALHRGGASLAAHSLEFYRFLRSEGVERGYLQGKLLATSAWKDVSVEDAELLLKDCLREWGICHQSMVEDLERILPELRKAQGAL